MTSTSAPRRRRIARFLRRTAAAAALLFAAAALVDVATYDAAAWRADYETLKREMAQRYANLDWIAAHRGLDLAALDAATSAALDASRSHVTAFLAFRRFVRAFGDLHLKIVRGERGAAAAETRPVPTTRPPDAPAGGSSEDAGYTDDDVAFRFPFARLAGWTPLRGGPFATGVVRDLGVLRIASFGEDRYLGACRAVFRPGIGRRELALAVRAQLNRELVAALTELRDRGARRLVVDVTGNGGGTEWVEDVVALMTDRTLVRRPSRHVAPQGDRGAVWRGQPVPAVFGPEGEPVRIVGRGGWTGPVFVLTDRGTGSAAEDFVVWLKENGVAVVLGRRTAGAGGGYVNGGGRIRLAAAPFDVMAPNCARFLSDGTNEIEGIAPDVELPSDDDRDRLAAAFAAATGL